MVERLLAKEEVASSTLVFRSNVDDRRQTPDKSPGSAVFSFPQILVAACVARLPSSVYRLTGPKWRNGRRDGLKNRWAHARVGSTPTFGTTRRRQAVGARRQGI